MGEKWQLRFKLVTGQIETIEINQVHDLDIDTTVMGIVSYYIIECNCTGCQETAACEIAQHSTSSSEIDCKL